VQEELNSGVLERTTRQNHELSTAWVAKEKGLINVPGQLQQSNPGTALCDLMFTLRLLSRHPITQFCKGLH